MKKPKADICQFDRFPDHIILQILNKLIDLKTLCICKLVSKRFYRIICQVDTVSFTVTRPDDNSSFFCKSFPLSINSICKFTSVKSLCIHFPSVCYDEYIDTRCLFKFSANRLKSFLFVSPNAIYDKNGSLLLSYRNGNQEEEEHENLHVKKDDIVFDCLLDTFGRFIMLLHCVLFIPWLEKISIMDSSKKRMFSVCRRKIVQVKDWLDSSSETIENRLLYCLERSYKITRCFIPSLELPVSRYVMKGVSAIFYEANDGDDSADDDSLMNGFGFDDDDYDGAEDKQKTVAYREAMTEILKNLERFLS